MPTPSHGLASLQSFYNTIQINMTTLKQPPESYGALLTSVILNKLPPETKTNMARDHYDSQCTVDELLASILKKIRIFEAGQQCSGRRTSSTPTTSSFVTATSHKRGTHEKPKRSISCIFCKGAHKPSLCTTITCHNERLAIVKNSGLCFNCLARHKVSQCSSRFMRKECNKKHHTSLCHAFTTTKTDKPPQPHPTTEQEQTTSSTTTTEERSPTAMNTASLSALHTSICLLKTAIADVSGGSSTVEGHILFDEGAQRSFITQELADKLQLQPTRHENISVSSFGEQVSAIQRLAVSSICIHSVNGIKLSVSVLVVPNLVAPVRNSVRTHLSQLPYLQGLTLAHPVISDENFDINVLIGADFSGILFRIGWCVEMNQQLLNRG